MRRSIVFGLNGRELEVGAEQAGWMLAEFLRQQRQLVGTKIVCAEGDCGACTVLKAAPYRSKSSRKRMPRFMPVNSCIIPVAQLDGAHVVTVDGLRSAHEEALAAATTPTRSAHEEALAARGAQPDTQNSGLTPVQKAMVGCHGSQCGFCTPGFVMALTGLVEKKLCRGEQKDCVVSAQEAKNATTGNLCRCTGYQPILDAAQAIDLSQCESVEPRYDSPTLRKRLAAAVRKSVWLENERFRFFAPTRLGELKAFLKKYPDARILAGGTDLGVLHNKRKQRLSALVSLHLIPALYEWKTKKARNGETVWIGARVTLAEVREGLEKRIPEFARFLDLFASPQIKNQGTLIGNLSNASPIGDTSPFLLVAGAQVEVFAPRTQKRRWVPIERFFLGYRKTALKPGEIILGVAIEVPTAQERLKIYKVSQRKDLDISTVSAAFRLRRKSGASKRTTAGEIESIRMAFGGVGATPLRFPKTEKLLKNRSVKGALTSDVFECFHAEMTPMSDLRSSSAFRRVVAENLLRKFFREEASTGVSS